MGLTLYVLIEYDDRILRNSTGGNSPFDRVTDCVIDLTDFVPLSHGKDYLFISAISGYENKTSIEPLYELRGLPPNIANQAKRRLDEYFDLERDSSISWLTLSEIESALSHMGISRGSLSFAVEMVLELMRYLENRLGKDSARLIFAVQ